MTRGSRWLAAVASLAAAAQALTLPSKAADAESALRVSFGSARLAWLRPFASANDDWINDIVPLRDGSYLGSDS